MPCFTGGHREPHLCGVLLAGGAGDSAQGVASSCYKDRGPAEGGFAMQEPCYVAEAGATGLVH